MKRSLIIAIVGTSAIINAVGQGGIIIGNYQAPYNPILWPSGFFPTPGGNPRVLSTHGVSLSLWFGEGILSADALTSSMALTWNTLAEANGYGGYYNHVNVVLPGWQPGDTYTFQVRASGNSIFGVVGPGWARSVLWQENENIRFIGGDPPGVPGVSTYSIGFVIVPEPSALGLFAMGALICFRQMRRRNQALETKSGGMA